MKTSIQNMYFVCRRFVADECILCNGTGSSSVCIISLISYSCNRLSLQQTALKVFIVTVLQEYRLRNSSLS